MPRLAIGDRRLLREGCQVYSPACQHDPLSMPLFLHYTIEEYPPRTGIVAPHPCQKFLARSHWLDEARRTAEKV